MAYCTEAQVQALLGLFKLSGASTPSLAQAIVTMDLVAAEINAALSSVNVGVPVTVPDYWLSDISYLNAVGAAAHILMAAFPSTVGPGSSSQGSLLWKAYQDRLKLIRGGDTIPSDVVIVTGDNNAMRDFFTDSNSIGVDDAEDAWGQIINSNPAFEREKVF